MGLYFYLGMWSSLSMDSLIGDFFDEFRGDCDDDRLMRFFTTFRMTGGSFRMTGGVSE